MGIFSRLFKVGQSEAHSLVDKLEDPIKMTEQGIRDLKKDLDNSLQALAEVKALAIRSKRELASSKEQAANYEKKAILLLKKVQNGQLDQAQADRLAAEALGRKEECLQTATRSEAEVQKFDENITQLEKNVNALKSKISHYENELRTLKARARVSDATKKINKSLSSIDSSGTISMLEKMKDKVAQDEALAEAYGDMGITTKSIDDEIDEVLNDTEAKGADSLADLKAKLGM
ncbi:MAG: PspA/IM30 family protein [Marinifilaceae bacterium]|jgi:phage shock protein A